MGHATFESVLVHESLNCTAFLFTNFLTSGTEVPMLKSGLATIMDPEEHQPFLVSFLESPESHKAEKAHRRRPSRVTRSAETGGANRQKRNKKTKKARTYDFPDVLDRPKSCQMGMLYVNFEDLGWKDWVIAPGKLDSWNLICFALITKACLFVCIALYPILNS